MIRKDKDGRWFARKRVTLADGSKHRLYVVPSRYRANSGQSIANVTAKGFV